jgi:plastocyanin
MVLFARRGQMDSAEMNVDVGTEIKFTWSDYFSVHIGVDLTVSYDNSGDQILPGCRLHAAATWRF